MKTHKNIYKQGEKLFVGGMTAAAIGFFSANPKTVKADSLSAGYLMAQNVQNSSKTQLSKAVLTESTSTDSSETEQSETMDKDAANDQQLNNSNSSQETNDSNNINGNDNSANSSAASEKNNTDLVHSDISKRDTENPNIVESTWNNIKVSYDTTQKSLTIYGGTKEKPVAVNNPNPILGTSDKGYIAGVNPLDITDIKIDGQLKLSGSVNFLFHGLTKLKTIEGLDNLDTSEVTDMSEMFSDSTMLLKLDLSNFNTVKVTRMYNMFHNCINLRYLDIHSFNMTNTSNVAGMLLTLESLKVLVLGKDNKIGLSDFQNKARWNSLGSGSISNPAGKENWTSKQVETNYHSNNISDIFISTIANPVFVHFRDEKGNQVTDQNGKIVPDTVEVGEIGTQPKAAEEFDCYKNAHITNYSLKKILINGSEVTPGSAEDIVDFKLLINDDGPDIYANQDVTFVFAKQPQGQVLISYQDESKNDLPDANGKTSDHGTVEYGEQGKKFTAPEIAGYKLSYILVNGEKVTGTDTASLDYNSKDQTVVFVYAKLQGQVLISYQDESKNDLPDANGKTSDHGTVEYGEQGKKFTAPEIAGYKLSYILVNGEKVTGTDTASLDYNSKDQTVVFVYAKLQGQVLISYQDESKNDLPDANGKTSDHGTVEYGEQGKKFTAPEIAGYKLSYILVNGEKVTGTDTASLDYNSKDQTVVFVYAKLQGQVLISYQDESKNDLPDANGKTSDHGTVEYGEQGKKFTAPEIAGYKLSYILVNGEKVTGTDTASLDYNSKDQTVVFVYAKLQGQVLISYQDESKNDLPDANGKTSDHGTVEYGEQGKKFTAPEIAGYKLSYILVNGEKVTGTDTASLDYNSKDQTVVFVYAKLQGQVLISYQDESKNDLPDANGKTSDHGTVEYGEQGKKFTAPEIAGYKLSYILVNGEKVTGTDTASLDYNSKDQTVVFVYAKLQGQVLISYQDESKNDLPDANGKTSDHGTVEYGEQGKKFTAPEIAGYKLSYILVNGEKVTGTDTASLDYNSKDQTVVFVYAKLQGQVLISYQDESKNDLPDANGKTSDHGTVEYGEQGKKFTAPEIAGYKLSYILVNGEKVTGTDTASLDYNSKDQTVVFVYAKLQGQVLISYQDESKNDLPDANGKASDHGTVEYGEQGKKFTAPEIAGYKLSYILVNGEKVTGTDTASLDYNSKDQTVVFVYAKLQGQVLISYQDESKNDLPDANGKTSDHGTVEYGEQGKKFTAPEIAGYKLSYILVNGEKVTGTDTASLDYNSKDQTVVFVYAKLQGQVLISYQDESKNDLPDANGKTSDHGTVEYGEQGKKFTAPEIAGYKLSYILVNGEKVTGTDTASLDYNSKDQTVVFVYAKLQGQVLISYQDESKNDLPDANGKTSDHGTVEYGEQGKKFTAPEIAGYKLSYILVNGEKVTGTDTASLDYNSKDQTVVFVYAKLQGQVLISYQDESKNDLPDANGKTSDHGTVEYGEQGKKFTAPEIAGYKLSYILVNGEKVTGTDTASLDYNSKDQTVVFVYKKDKKPEPDNLKDTVTPNYRQKAAPVTVKYQDEFGNTLAENIVLNGYVGDGYTTGSEPIAGYTLETRPDNATGFFSAYPQSVIYVYAKDNQDSPQTNDGDTGKDKTNKTDKTGKSNKVTETGNHKRNNSGKNNDSSGNLINTDSHNSQTPTKVANNNNAKKDEKIPQTGSDEHSQLAALLLGFMATISSTVGAWFNRKKKE